MARLFFSFLFVATTIIFGSQTVLAQVDPNGTNGNLNNDVNITNDGTTNNGTTNDGTINNGTTNDGTTNDGTTNNGTTNDGTTNNGTTNNGTTNNGTTNNGTTNDDEYAEIGGVDPNDNTDNDVVENISYGLGGTLVGGAATYFLLLYRKPKV